MAAGRAFDIALVGMRAMDSMRLEKSYRLWGTDLNAENSLLAAGLGLFVRLSKGEFTGRDTLVPQQAEGVPTTLCPTEIDAADADSFSKDPIYIDGEVGGRGTPRGSRHHLGQS